MDDLINRVKDLKTSIPGALAIVYAVVDLFNEYGFTINISQRSAFSMAVIMIGVGLLLSGYRHTEAPKEQDKKESQP
jgi:hypothetical protein